MQVLLIDADGCFLDFALRCIQAGHKVRLFCSNEKDGSRSRIGEGLGIRVEEWKPHMKWADIIILSDNDKYMREIGMYQQRGFPIIGGNEKTAELEFDRQLGQDAFKKAGLSVIPGREFNNYDQAIKYVQSTKGCYACKPNGNVAKELTHCAKNAADMLVMLNRWKKKHPLDGGFCLQEFVEGTEFGVAGWLGKNGFLRYVEESFEHKPLMNDNYGQNVGETGTALKYVDKANSKLYRETLAKLEDRLLAMNYRGSVSVNCIITEDGEAKPLEWTTRLGWPEHNIHSSLVSDPVEWMLAMLDGEDVFRPNTDAAVGVVVTIAPFPHTEKMKNPDVDGYPVWGIDADNSLRYHIHPVSLRWGKSYAMDDDDVVEKEMFVTCGDYLAVCVGVADTVVEAKKAAYRTVDSISTPLKPQLRTDISARLKDGIPALQANGFASEWVYF